MIFQHPVQLLSYPSHDKFIYLRVYDLYIKIVSYKKKIKIKITHVAAAAARIFKCNVTYTKRNL